MASISTHNGSKVSIEHNDRDEQFIKNEMAKQQREKGTQHIRADGEHETWRKGNLREFYKREFSESVKEYNAKQKREDRKIADYYEKICQDKKRHPCYEMIVGVYGADVSPEVGKSIVKEFFEGWDERNPNLKLFSCNWHNDEQNKNLNGHAHHDYVPVCENCRSGPKKGTSLNQALREMGFIDKGPLTAQMQWQARENKVLEEICIRHGLVVERQKEKKEHKEKDIYIQEQRAEQASQRLSEALTGIEEAKVIRDELDVQIAHREARKATLTNDIEHLSNGLEQSADLVHQLNEDVGHVVKAARKQPIERLEETPAKKTILGKEKPGTSLVITEQLDELERSPGLTPSDTWKLDKVESGLRRVSSTINLSREKELEERVQELEQQIRQHEQRERALTKKIQMFKDWVIDIVERELSQNRIGHFIIQKISQRVQKAINEIENTSIELSQEQNQDRIERQQ